MYVYMYIYTYMRNRLHLLGFNPTERCPVRLSKSQAVSLIQHVLMTLVLRLIVTGGFSFDSANRVFRVLPGCMGKPLVIAVRSST